MRFALLLSVLTFIPLAAHALTFHPDVTLAVRTQMEQDLDFTFHLQGRAQSPYHKSVFGSLSGDSYQVFFEDRIHEVGMDDCGSPQAVACVLTYLHPINVMWLTKNYYKFSHPQIARVMTLFHESRHTENRNNNWFHADCPIPFLDENGNDRVSSWTGVKLEGLPGCDKSAFGSYGISVIMLQNISKSCSNCTEKVRMDADLYSSDELNRMYLPEVKNAMINDFRMTVPNATRRGIKLQ